MKNTKALAFSICFFIAVHFSMAQGVVKGKIFDDSTHAPIRNAAIYLPELNQGILSDELGEYIFKNIPKGKFKIQVSSLGYATAVRSFYVESDSLKLNITLHLAGIETPEIVVYGTQTNSLRETPNQISSYSQNEMRSSGSYSISDAISHMPGVNQLSTGLGISKPVIRGLFGNRIQTVMMGMRFDNQQWQDEHGLGLSDVGVDRVEILKGPVSLLYGSEAMGGVLNIIEEKNAPIGSIRSDVSLKLFSNTLGGGIDGGVKSSGEKSNWKIRLGAESNADYNEGGGRKILNSRFDGYYGKFSYGFNRNKWVSQNNYMISLSDFGFIMEIEPHGGVADARLARNFAMPHHTVLFNIVSSQNTFFLKKSKLKMNLGWQNNNRQEQEGGNKISLNMLLNSYAANLQWVKPLGKSTDLTLGTQSLYQTNLNLGSRTIVPDATIFESSAFSYLKHSFKWLVVETGMRYDQRNIKTFYTGTINNTIGTPGDNVTPFNVLHNSLNGSFGGSFILGKYWNIKTNFSSGYRTGNLAELSSNGLHEGTLRYEIGDPAMKVEQNFCTDMSLLYENSQFRFSASVYNNAFMNYIYLSPTGTQYLGLDIYRYVQKDATLKGAEATFDFHPKGLSWFDINATYSMIRGTTGDGNYLPFIPADKLLSEIRMERDTLGKIVNSYFKIGTTYVFDQTSPAQFETSTPSYLLLNAGIGGELSTGKRKWILSLVCNNVLDKKYFDHLSRYKYFGIYNIGRNIALNVKFLFN